MRSSSAISALGRAISEPLGISSCGSFFTEHTLFPTLSLSSVPLSVFSQSVYHHDMEIEISSTEVKRQGAIFILT